ncbi:HipA family kinase [Aneurinibacillus migulanus]|uniref:HipA-like kinase domain-containing protein n=1 Tax=Aneurinibacillus migulanus TaxID=47500 RepID=A0A0D1V7X7_ANEMI|nr:HipA family kinase [Aneurinibacillus migulanus]KIV55459.1 hypothetical protein TS65_15940 [Aneurinibacillus migulanus]KON90756.1 hypothetical protein AF333_27315 [Aneurinibacillus migulanus]MED0895360.1 hypothetical protein [Aneurinibacillus migulanus]MED1618016.1 hypothetical protein [Aneurinibacillus migulanus]MED4732122.1 hypothetical protein [Aneurinibacillus migulanus]
MIQPVAYQRKVEGKSGAHLITFDDGRDYVVKFLKPEFEKMLANEWIGYCLARFMQLPVPCARIVEIPPEFYGNIPDMDRFVYTKRQFASLYIENCKNGYTASNMEIITNVDSLAGIILLDYWLYNRDRTRKNILLQEEATGEYRLWMIDQSEILGSYSWSLSELEALPDTLLRSATHQIMGRFIKDEAAFEKQLQIIRTIPRLLLEEIVSLIPDEWQVSAYEREKLVNVLLFRRDQQLPLIMKQFTENVYQPLKRGQK